MIAILDRERSLPEELTIGRSDEVLVGNFSSTNAAVHDARHWEQSELTKMAGRGDKKVAPLVAQLLVTRGPDIEQVFAEIAANARQASSSAELRLHELDAIEGPGSVSDATLDALEETLNQGFNLDLPEEFTAGIVVSPRRREVTLFAADNHEMTGAGPTREHASQDAQHGHGGALMYELADTISVLTDEGHKRTLDKIRERTDAPVTKAVAATFRLPRQPRHVLPGVVRNAVGLIKEMHPRKPVHA